MQTNTFNLIGIIGAMDIEIELLKQTMEEAGEVRCEHHAGMEFFRGLINKREAVVVRCGIGMVNAAACTQALADHFDVDGIINTGVAGSLDAQLDIGDVLIATGAVNHIMDLVNLGYDIGQTPGYASNVIPCDAQLSSTIDCAATKLAIKHTTGLVASGDRFVRAEDDKERIVSTFGCSCCEMEGAAIAQVCANNKLPCTIVRAISDKADGSSTMDYQEFEAKAAEVCANLVATALQMLP